VGSARHGRAPFSLGDRVDRVLEFLEQRGELLHIARLPLGGEQSEPFQAIFLEAAHLVRPGLGERHQPRAAVGRILRDSHEAGRLYLPDLAGHKRWVYLQLVSDLLRADLPMLGHDLQQAQRARRLPPVASADVTMRYWRPQAAGRRSLLIGYSRAAARFCTGYRLLARISSANDSDEGGQPIARCTLRGTLAQVWPSIVATQEN
jgi:hypothetical protein